MTSPASSQGSGVPQAELPKPLADLAAAIGNLGIAYLADSGMRLLAASPSYRDLMGLGPEGDAVPARHMAIATAAIGADAELTGSETIGRGLAATTYLTCHRPLHDAHGTVVGVLGILLRAMDDQHGGRSLRDRNRLQDFIRATADWVWETDRNGSISFVSDRITEVLGLPPVLLLGRPFAELGRPFDGGGRRTSAMAAMHTRRPFRAAEVIVEDREGQERRFLLNGVPAFDQQGEFQGYRGTATDVTAARRAEAAAAAAQAALQLAHAELERKNVILDEALRRAQRSEAAKRNFLATMSHELRTPLNAVIGFAELMAAQGATLPQPRVQGYVGDISVAAHHLLRLIDDLLEAATIEGASLKLSVTDMPLGAAIASARTIAGSRAAARQVRIDVSGLPPAASVHADPTRLLQVLVNVLDHAIRRAPEGSAVLVASQEAAGQVAVTVTDQGPPISPADRPRLFETFGRLGPSIAPAAEADLGLGLAIAHGLARAMGGDLAVTETGTGGTTLRLTLPASGAPLANS